MLVVDAGPIVAAAMVRDRHHEACAELLAHASRLLVVPVLVARRSNCCPRRKRRRCHRSMSAQGDAARS
jgi:hypothetical protein